jgi:predicted nucleic acid-binding protein
MILVDTSILIDYLKGNINKHTERFDEVVRNEISFGINNYIYQELLQGTASEKEFNNLDEYLNTQRFYNLQEGLESYKRAAHIYYKCRRSGIIVNSTIDLLIAETAIENNLMLFHNDTDFTKIAKIIKELHIY